MESVVNNVFTKLSKFRMLMLLDGYKSTHPVHNCFIISSSILVPNGAPVKGERVAKGGIEEGKRSVRRGVRDGGAKGGLGG